MISTGDLTLVMGKYDHSMPVGLDHRCVHCVLQSRVGKKGKWKRRISCKNWQPQLGCDDAPTQQQNHIRQQLHITSRVTAVNLGCSKKWSEQASNNMFSSIHAVETFESITGTDNRSTLAQNMGFAISETSSSCGTCLEYESTSNVSRYCFKREKKGRIYGNFCLGPLENMLWCNLMTMFLACMLGGFVCWSHSAFGEAERSDQTVADIRGATSCGTSVENA